MKRNVLGNATEHTALDSVFAGIEVLEVLEKVLMALFVPIICAGTVRPWKTLCFYHL